MSENLGTVHARLELAIDDFINNSQEAQQEIKSGSKKIKSSLEDLSATASDNFENISNASLAIGAGMASAGAVVGASLLAMTGQFIESEKTMKKFASQTGKTGDELKGFEKSIKESYLDGYGENLEEVTQAYSDFTRALGTNETQTKTLTDKAFQLKEIFGFEINDTLRATSSLMKNLNVDGTTAMDLITKSVQVAGDRSEDLLDTVAEYSARFAEAGISADEMFNILVKGVQSGARDYDTVADSVKEFNILLTEGGDNAKEALSKVLKMKDVKYIMKSIADGTMSTGDAMGFLVDKIANMDNKTKQANVATSLFGTLWEEVGIKGLQAMTDGTKAITDYDGVLKKSHDTLQGQGVTLEQVKRQFGEVSEKIGAELAPYMAQALTKASELILKLLEFIKFNPIATKIIAVLGVIFSVLGTIIGLIILISPYIEIIVAGFLSLTSVIASVGAVAGAVFGFIVSLPGLIVVAIVALVAVIIWKWDEVKRYSIMIWTAIVNFILSIPDLIKGAWNNFINTILELWIYFKIGSIATWNSFLTFLKSVPGKILNFFTSTLPFIIGFIIGRFIYLVAHGSVLIGNFFTKTIPNLVKSGFNFVVNLFTVYIPRLLLKLAMLAVQGVLKMEQLRKGLILKAQQILTGVVVWFAKLPAKILSFLGRAKSATERLGKSMVDGLKNKMKQIPKTIETVLKNAIKGVGKFGSLAYSKLKRIGSSMWSGFKKGLGISSPSYLERAMFAISDEGENLKDSLFSSFRSIKRIPSISTMADLASDQRKATVNNNNNRNITQNFNGPLVSLTGSQLSQGQATAYNMYDYITFKKRSMGVSE